MPKPMLRQMSKDGRSIRSSTQRRMNSCHGRQYCPAIQVRTRNSSDHCSNRLSWNAGRSRWYTMPTFTVGMPRHSIPRLMVVVPRLLLSRRTMVQPLLVGTIPRGGADLAERGRPWRHFCFTKETAAAAAAVEGGIASLSIWTNWRTRRGWSRNECLGGRRRNGCPDLLVAATVASVVTVAEEAMVLCHRHPAPLPTMKSHGSRHRYVRRSASATSSPALSRTSRDGSLSTWTSSNDRRRRRRR
mmetsp:Transcript_27684/g.55951  ORF Transcript_27684/g.55951 Transcript_27684/m.55951 type:complete len:244 (-) Transcript_27684:593-1324(-)